jgi:hypothetical protein
MKKLLFLAIAFIALSATAQTKVFQNPNAIVRPISTSFSQVSVATGIELYITEGSETALAISVSDPKYLEKFKTVVENGVLKLYMDTKGIAWLKDKNRKLKAYLSVASLQKLSASSGASIYTAKTLTFRSLKIDMSSGAKFTGSVNIADLNISQDSGSQLDISGTATTLKVAVSSGAHFKGFDLITENCVAKVSSGAHANITTNKELDASAISGGVLRYKGSAGIASLTVNSGGSVKKS